MTSQERVCLVTGGAGTIGFEVGRQLAAAGVAVIVNGRDLERCRKAANRLIELYPQARVTALAADVSDYAACVDLVAACEAAYGRLDILVHCAQSTVSGSAGLFSNTDPGQYPKLMQQAVCAPMYLCHAALPALRRAGGGSIVAFPSDAGKVAAPNQTLVGATRAAVMMFMRSLALEVSGDGIRCNCIAPTFVDTPALREAAGQGPHASRIAKAVARAKLGLPTPEELAAMAVFLASPAAAHVTGQVISVNGGLNAA
jgi:NAD(P)-dependent dehydrogenase (short-subunit alcohol dehydrogenase family)